MHDPSSVAFEIKYPWVSSVSILKDGTKIKHRESFITIWHEDPCDFSQVEMGRSDDSCGWHTPLLRKGESEEWTIKAMRQWEQLFERTKALSNGSSYASICTDPQDTFTAVYWLWRHFKHEYAQRAEAKSWWRRLFANPWQYGDELTFAEYQACMVLATNPVDNVQLAFRTSAPYPPGAQTSQHDDFLALYGAVHRAYRRHARPWYRHPRWHVHHWRIQVHPWMYFYRWAFTRCAECGGRFRWKETPVGGWDTLPHGFWEGEKGLRHMNCSGEERIPTAVFEGGGPTIVYPEFPDVDGGLIGGPGAVAGAGSSKPMVDTDGPHGSHLNQSRRAAQALQVNEEIARKLRANEEKARNREGGSRQPFRTADPIHKVMTEDRSGKMRLVHCTNPNDPLATEVPDPSQPKVKIWPGSKLLSPEEGAREMREAEKKRDVLGRFLPKGDGK